MRGEATMRKQRLKGKAAMLARIDKVAGLVGATAMGSWHVAAIRELVSIRRQLEAELGSQRKLVAELGMIRRLASQATPAVHRID